jgi:hypothetical protein
MLTMITFLQLAKKLNFKIRMIQYLLLKNLRLFFRPEKDIGIQKIKKTSFGLEVSVI